MASTAPLPPIVLVHGFWVTPRSWEHWKARYEARGHQVIAPAYPGFEVEVEALNADPTPIVDLKPAEVVATYEAAIAGLPSEPIIIGHSAGGAFTQILLDRGHGLAGVALNSVGPEGVMTAPLSQLRSVFPILKNPANHHRAVGFTHEQWHYAFTNGFSEEESRRLYERYHVPASGRVLIDGILANVKPGHQDIYVNFENDDRAPLLLVSGSEDHIMPPAVQKSTLKHYTSDTVTELIELEGPHLMIAGEGWETIADTALDWALEHAREPEAAA